MTTQVGNFPQIKTNYNVPYWHRQVLNVIKKHGQMVSLEEIKHTSDNVHHCRVTVNEINCHFYSLKLQLVINE